MFCSALNLTDDWTLKNQSQERANVQLALYATHLATGSTLHCRTIKSATINGYITDVAKFLSRFRDVDPRFASPADTKIAPIISKVIQEQRRWETVPNRREPFTMALQNILSQKATESNDSYSFDTAIADWTLCNMYAGCRGIEWAQTSTTQAQLYTHHLNIFKRAYAFTLADVQCLSASHARLTIAQAVAAPNLVDQIKLRFDEQKNDDHHEWKLFVRNTNNTHLCFVNAFLRIIKRYLSLVGTSELLPLSVYRTVVSGSSEPVVLNITTARVEIALRAAASKAYNLDPIKNKKQLQLWSAHSLRVGACATLYAQGFGQIEIKFLLRWKSDAFMTYLRNLAVTSRRHNEALNEVAKTPNFL